MDQQTLMFQLILSDDLNIIHTDHILQPFLVSAMVPLSFVPLIAEYMETVQLFKNSLAWTVLTLCTALGNQNMLDGSSDTLPENV